MDWKGATGGSETSEVEGMVQQEVLEPELGQEQRPRVKLEPIPEAVLSPPREVEWTGVDSGGEGSRLSLIKCGQGRGEATMVGTGRGPEASAP